MWHAMNIRFLLILWILVVLTLTAVPAKVSAGGVCILHPQPFKLRSDTVRWSMKIKSGEQCIQGLRWATLMIDTIVIAKAPQSGRLVLGGPSFRYISEVTRNSSDYFEIAISGSSLGIDGTSVVEVDVRLE